MENQIYNQAGSRSFQQTADSKVAGSVDYFSDIVLGRKENYDPNHLPVLPFKTIGDPVDGIECRLSNMAGGFPFEFEGHTYKNSEVLYLIGEFSTGSERMLYIQKDILSATSGYASKRFKKAKYKAEVRKDFKEFRLQWMLFVVWQKCNGSEDFRKHLAEFPEESILVENTTTDNQGSAEIWGCLNPELIKARKELANSIRTANPDLPKKHLDRVVAVETNKLRKIGTWQGENNIGKILMICRRALAMGVEPPIDYQFLSSFDIYILGRKVDFAKYASADVQKPEIDLL